MNLKTCSIDEQIIDKSANFELPNASAAERAKPYGPAYTIRAGKGELFANGLCRIDGRTLETTHFEFGPEEYCGEPVMLDGVEGLPGRYLISQVYRNSDRISYFAVFEDSQFVHGPIARIPLRHHAPLSFHGFWSEA